MISETLQKARNFENQYASYADSERPAFHVTGGIGWINDPNGFSVYKGEYHLFFQYHPYSTNWGPMHWGHVKTKDFITWERLPVALAPDTEYDKDGCFSGSAIELPDGRHLLMYTGVKEKRREDGVVEAFQHQCIAVGDGINYEKYDGNPVLGIPDLPADSNPHDFRDPKIWYEDGRYYTVVGNRPADGSGAILMYESEDAFHWRSCGILDVCHNQYGKMWECPDFFPLGDQRVLLVSPQEMTAVGLEFHAGFGTVCLIGDYDSSRKVFTRKHVQAIDYGIDFYAPQTLETEDGRRIMIAWMQNWTTVGSQLSNIRIFGSMTLPRELTLKDGRLIQNPVRELENYHCNKITYENVMVHKEMNLNGVSGRRIDLTVTVQPFEKENYHCFRLNLAKDGEHSTTIRYKTCNSTVRVDRTGCGSTFDIVHVRDFHVKADHGRVKFRVIMDGNSVELFVNDGEQVATFLLYLDDISAKSISFEADAPVMIDVTKYDIEV